VRLAACIALCILADAAVMWSDFLAKRWVLGLGTSYLVAAATLCNVSLAAWFAFFKLHGDLGRAAAIWNSTGILAAVVIGIVAYQERLTTTSWFGLAFCLTGVVLLGLQK